MSTAQAKLQRLVADPAKYGKEARTRARAAGDREVARAVARKQGTNPASLLVSARPAGKHR